MGQVLDFVPNHMGVGHADNQWWLDVLEWGQDSQFGKFFDIDWQVADPALRGKVLLPVLGENFGEAIIGGKIKLVFDAQAGTFSLWYGEHRFPIRPVDYAAVLRNAGVPEATHFAESFKALGQPGLRKGTRLGSASSLKADLAQAVLNQPLLAEAFQAAADSFGGVPGEKSGWWNLVGLVEKQNYRLASWRLAADEINYRRFFDINDLAGVRVEDDDLFELMHRMLSRLVAQGSLHGVRLDHIDGLHDPAGYLTRLYRYLGRFGAPADAKSKGRDRFYILVEKILATDEELRRNWPIAGTTGYEFLSDTTALFVDPAAETEFDDAYKAFTGIEDDFEAIAIEAKHVVIRNMLPADLSRLSRRLKHIADRDWNSRDYSLSRLRIALYEVVRGFKVYRTYATSKQISAEDRMRIGQAVQFAKAHWHAPDISILDFVEKALTGDLLREPQADYKKADVIRLHAGFPAIHRPRHGEVAGGYCLLPLLPPRVAERSWQQSRPLRHGHRAFPRRQCDAREAPAEQHAGIVHPRHEAGRGYAQPDQRAVRVRRRVADRLGEIATGGSAVARRPVAECERRVHDLPDPSRHLARRCIRLGSGADPFTAIRHQGHPRGKALL